MKVQATRNVKHDGVMYTAGVEFEVSEAEAKELVELGAAVEVEEKAEPAKKDEAKADESKADDKKAEPAKDSKAK
jgi:hypothetical protein